jgi:tRNA (guanine26-N2/guanine27-N2)-dimethyltransferase
MKEMVKEGLLDLEVDSQEVVSKDLEVFYNPKMSINRTFSVALFKAWGRSDLLVGLPLAGTGVRGLRLLKEVESNCIEKIFLNDYNPLAKDVFEKNVKLNSMEELVKEKIVFYEMDANRFLQESKGFDYIDIDPYGSPNFLLDSAISRLRANSILAVTATDTAPLSGTYPSTCKRKYWSNPLLCPQKHELGLRILARKVMLIGLHCERALKPILAYHDEHYYRIFFVAQKSKQKSSALYEELEGMFSMCKKCGFQESVYQAKDVKSVCECKEKLFYAGPMYSGQLQNNKWLEKISDVLGEEDKQVKNIISWLIKDGEIPANECMISYDTHYLCKLNKLSVQKIEKYIEYLASKGFRAQRTCFPITGIKTQAKFKDVIRCLEECAKE